MGMMLASRIGAIVRRAGAGTALVCAVIAARAAMGVTQIESTAGDGPVTLYYATAAQEQPLQRGRLTIMAADNATPQRGNDRLVVISHGSGGAPWVHADLARALVEAGYVVAVPEHRHDNWRDPSVPGPESW